MCFTSELVSDENVYYPPSSPYHKLSADRCQTTDSSSVQCLPCHKVSLIAVAAALLIGIACLFVAFLWKDLEAVRNEFQDVKKDLNAFDVLNEII